MFPIAVADILGRDHEPADYRALPRATFTDPEIGSVGPTEAQARDAGLAVAVGEARVPSTARGWIHKAGNEGVIKMVADTDRGVLVGATAMGPNGGEVIGALTVAVHAELSIDTPRGHNLRVSHLPSRRRGRHRSDAAMTTTDPATMELADPDGNPVSFSELAADPLVVILVRYYGCLPCQAFVQDVDAALGRFPDSARVVTVGGSADFQARWLRDDQGLTMPLLVDPDQQVRALADVGNLKVRQLLSPKGGASYLRAMRRGLRPQKVTRDTVRAPGVAIFGPDLELRWVYEGDKLGDYPSVDELVRRASA